MDQRSPRPTPPAAATTASLVGLRTIAVLEAAKGGLVLLIGVGLLSVLHRDVGAVAAHLVSASISTRPAAIRSSFCKRPPK